MQSDTALRWENELLYKILVSLFVLSDRSHPFFSAGGAPILATSYWPERASAWLRSPFHQSRSSPDRLLVYKSGKPGVPWTGLHSSTGDSSPHSECLRREYDPERWVSRLYDTWNEIQILTTRIQGSNDVV